MATEDFVRWVMDEARNVEELYTVEVLVEQAMHMWRARHKIYQPFNLEEAAERKRQRALNPAYTPQFIESSLRAAVEMLPEIKSWTVRWGFDDRPIRDLAVLRFLPDLEEFKLGTSEVTDLRLLPELPRLRVLHFGSKTCRDFRLLGECTGLRELAVTLAGFWPEVAGLEKLQQLETLSLTGNFFALAPGIVWPRVRRATLHCAPLAMRCARDLPQLPLCEFLSLTGVDRLDGIEAFPRLRNLTLTGPVQDFSPLAALKELTWFSYNGAEPLAVAPLARLPQLQVAAFHSQHTYGVDKAQPRDYAPLTDAPMLRELHVVGCPPVDAEVATINTLLLPWDDVLLAPQPCPVPPLRMIVAPQQRHPIGPDLQPRPSDAELIDDGLRGCQIRWIGRFVEQSLSARLGQSDWGNVSASGTARQFSVHVESFAMMEKFPAIIEALRETLARLLHEYHVTVYVQLKAPQLEATPAQVELEKQFREERDREEFEQRQREQREYLDRLHRHELKKEAGEEIDPKEFVPAPQTPLPPPPWERDEDEEDDDSGDGDLAVKKKPDPPPSWLDDDHPLAENYRLWGTVTVAEVWFVPQQRDVAVYLMRREPDQALA